MADRHQWERRIKAVEREYLAVYAATERLMAMIRVDATQLPDEFKLRDLKDAAENLEATFLIRLFAEFEAGLRNFWVTQRQTVPPMHQLLNAIAARRQIPYEYLNRTQAVRELRNAHVHEGNTVQRLSLAVSRNALCTFFSFLPPTW